MTNIICFVCGFCMWYGTSLLAQTIIWSFPWLPCCSELYSGIKNNCFSSPSNCRKLQTTISVQCYHNNRTLGSRPSHKEGKMHVLT